MSIYDEIAIPRGVNTGLTSPSASYLASLLGAPKWSAPHLVTESVGPFNVTGFSPAVASLRATLEDIQTTAPDVHGSPIGTAGMLNVRYVAGTTTYSNHSWGVAVDITLGGRLDDYGDGYSLEGLARIAPTFNAHGWYWGATFPKEDSMHFEISREKLALWADAGLFNKSTNYIWGAAGNDTKTGGNSADFIAGYQGNDSIVGGNGNDRLFGDLIRENTRYPGNDTLSGGAGNDTLEGGGGRDILTGGSGQDRFMYSATSDSSNAAYDYITDFARGQDKIDVSLIDANTKTAANDAFTFVPFSQSGKLGTITYTTHQGNGFVLADNDGVYGWDVVIQLQANLDLTKGDFIL